MIKLRAGVLLLGVSALLIWPAASERGLQAQMTAADYARAERFLSWNAQRLVSGTSVDPQWMAGDRFWYRNRTDNVHPNATLLLVDELIDHNKDFDLMVLPNRNHRFLYEPYVIRRTWDYFVRNLLDLEPPREYGIKPPPPN